MALFGRIIVIAFAVIVASIAAGIAIAIGLLGPQWHSVSGDVGERVMFWGAAFVGATGIGAVGLLPLAILQTFGVTVPVLFVSIGAATLVVATAIWRTMPKAV